MSRFAKHNLHLLSDMKNQVLLTESPLQYSKPNLEHKPSTNSSFLVLCCLLHLSYSICYRCVTIKTEIITIVSATHPANITD